jgi:Protein of unknown function (DUF3515)
MTRPVRRRPHPAVLIAIALPLLLAVTLAGAAVAARLGWIGGPPAPDATPLAVVPVEAPAAADPGCTALLAALPAELDADPDALPARPLVEPAPPGVRAWAAAPRPVVLRCGLPRPAELTPTSALLEINGVRWLPLRDPAAAVVTYVAVDRPVYVVLTTPADLGSGPVQQIADAVRDTLPSVPVAVR